MFKYEKPEMELLLLDAEDLFTVSDGGNITDPDEGETPYIPPTGVQSI